MQVSGSGTSVGAPPDGAAPARAADPAVREAGEPRAVRVLPVVDARAGRADASGVAAAVAGAPGVGGTPQSMLGAFLVINTVSAILAQQVRQRPPPQHSPDGFMQFQSRPVEIAIGGVRTRRPAIIAHDRPVACLDNGQQRHLLRRPHQPHPALHSFFRLQNPLLHQVPDDLRQIRRRLIQHVGQAPGRPALAPVLRGKEHERTDSGDGSLAQHGQSRILRISYIRVLALSTQFSGPVWRPALPSCFPSPKPPAGEAIE